MDDVELMKKIFLEKEKENMKLKEELRLAQLNKKTPPKPIKTISKKETESPVHEKRKYSVTPGNKNHSNNIPIVIKVNTSFSENTNEETAIVKKIENQIGELKEHCINYEKEFEEIYNLNKLIYPNERNMEEKVHKYELLIEDILKKLKEKDNEKTKLKDFYEKEIRIKNELYNQSISQLTKDNDEKFKKIKVEYENKILTLTKKNEEDIRSLNQKIVTHDMSKIEIKTKNEFIEFQRNYLVEMKELQQNMLMYRQEKEEAEKKTYKYKEYLFKLKQNFEDCEKQFAESEKKYKLKLENHKILLENNKFLSSQLDQARKEVLYLKLQVNKLEESEKRLHNIIMKKDINCDVTINYDNCVETTHLGKDCSQFLNNSTENEYSNQLTTSLHLDSNHKKKKKNNSTNAVHQKIMEMEKNLQLMNEENEILKTKLGQTNDDDSYDIISRNLSIKRAELKKKLASISTSMIEDNFANASTRIPHKRNAHKSISPNRTNRSVYNRSEQTPIYIRSPIANTRSNCNSKD